MNDQIEDNPVGWLYYDAYDNKQWILHLENEKEVRLFEIMEMEGTEVKKALKAILKEYDDVVSQEAYDIENCQIIEYIIRFLDETPVVEKQGYRLLKEHE